ncbi:MAG: phenylalanine--tRNA ligase subunit beta [Candidatus Paceibacterota bacterium]
MKFSYNLFKKYLPQIKSKDQLENALSMHVFETEESEGNTIDISISPNRYSEGASHIGIAKELKNILDLKEDNIPELNLKNKDEVKTLEDIKINIKNKDLCSRYTAQIFEEIKVNDSPKWLVEILKDCGLRPINNVVDIMNYVMLETGQPLHAFDADKLEEITIRNAKEKEEFISIDNEKYELSKEDLVIAGKSSILAVAGIKGGKFAEVTKETKRILVESANFDGTSIYKTSRNINLITDASLKFSHNLNKALAFAGLKRAEEILKEIINAKPGGLFDSNSKLEEQIKIDLDTDKIRNLIGFNLTDKEIKSILEKLEFSFEGDELIVPILRDDIRIIEDIAEEVVRIYGLNKLKAVSPLIDLKSPKLESIFKLNRNLRSILKGAGFNEVYLHSFVSEGDKGSIKVVNPISEEKNYLRKDLKTLLINSLEENKKFDEEVRIFELGKVFSKEKETEHLSIAIHSEDFNPFFEIKGVLSSIFDDLGITNYDFDDADFDGLVVKINKNQIGKIFYFDNKTIGEIDINELLNFVKEETSFKSLSKYPAVKRDISLITKDNIKIGDVIQEIKLTDKELIREVDLIDEYFGDDGKQSITLRIIFQSEDKTLSNEEVNERVKKIVSNIEKRFNLSLQ